MRCCRALRDTGNRATRPPSLQRFREVHSNDVFWPIFLGFLMQILQPRLVGLHQTRLWVLVPGPVLRSGAGSSSDINVVDLPAVQSDEVSTVSHDQEAPQKDRNDHVACCAGL